MQKIPILLAKPGMELARDVYRDSSLSGTPVCAKGTELTDDLIGRLAKLGIKSLFVIGHCQHSLVVLLQDLDTRFAKVRQDPLAEKLRLAYVDYLTKTHGGSVGPE